MVRALALFVVVLVGFSGGALAQSCGSTYTVRPGDSLSVIAERQYDNAFAWTGLYEINRSTIGPDPDRILVGSRLYVPCSSDEVARVAAGGALYEDAGAGLTGPDGPEKNVDALPPLAVGQVMNLPPFADDSRADGGMLTELIRTATGAGFPLRDVVLASPASPRREALSGLIYPVMRPGCPTAVRGLACDEYLYSDPLFEMLMLFFVPAEDPVPMARQEDLRGKHLCSPAGQPVDMPDAAGHDRLSGNLVTFVRAPDAGACFALLATGSVDAVLVDEFTGRAAAANPDRAQDVVALDKSPAGIVTLNVAVHRTAPDAQDLITGFNAGLREIRVTGAFQKVLDRHMAVVWAGL